MTTTGNTEVTVAIPTVGRMTMLTACLESIADNGTQAREVLLLDQSDGDEVALLPARFPSLKLRVVRCLGKGIARNMNLALTESTTEKLLVTHDDCVVASDWIEAMNRALDQSVGAVITGRVLPGGERPGLVPSTIDDPNPRDHTGTLNYGALYPANMGLYREKALSIGGFDERTGFATAAEDLDFCYRWLKAKGELRYDPTVVVTHNDWRSPDEAVKLYRHYARCAGRFYGKHLAQGDRDMAGLAFIAFRQGVKAIRHRTDETQDSQLEARQVPVWMPIGLAEGIAEELGRRRNP